MRWLIVLSIFTVRKQENFEGGGGEGDAGEERKRDFKPVK